MVFSTYHIPGLISMASWPSLRGKCQEVWHFTRLALALSNAINHIYSFEVKVKDFKTDGSETESYIEGACGVHSDYLSGLSSFWPETQIPRKKWRALSPNLGTIQPSMCPPLEQSSATPPPAGPE